MNHPFRLAPVLLIAVAFVPFPAGAAVIITDRLFHADSHASFDYNGTHYSDSMGVEDATSASSQALAGTSLTPEGRTAARISLGELAVNARLDGKTLFTLTEILDDASTASVETTLFGFSGGPEHVFMTFLIPSSYVETTTNAEFQDAEVVAVMHARIQSKITSAQGVPGPLVDEFRFQGALISTYRSFTPVFNAEAQPGLDVSPLLNPTLTDGFSVDRFTRTTNLALAAYEGTIDLGVLGAGETLTVTYQMQASSSGSAAYSVGIASINDPFFFDSDPVTAGAPVAFRFVPVAQAVPEPASWAMLAGAAVITLVGRRQRTAQLMRRSAGG